MLILGVLIGISPVVGQMYTEYREQRMIDEWLSSVDVAMLGDFSEGNTEEAYSSLKQVFAAKSGSTDAEGGAADAVGAAGGKAGSIEGAASEGATQAEGASANAGANQQGSLAQGESGGSSHADYSSSNQSSKQTVLGVIQIKKIKVRAAIVEGVSESNLSTGIGHIPGTAFPGQAGNCALAGHRSYTFGKFFRRLDELKEGDEIIINTKKEDLKYKVFKIYTVTPDDISILKGSKDDNIITLITCTPVYIASHRLIVTARLTERVLREP